MKCPLCEQGKPYYDDTYSRWDDLHERGLAGVKGTMIIDPGQNLDVQLELVNQHVTADNNQMPYPLQLSFAIRYCPLCGREIKWLDSKLLSI